MGGPTDNSAMTVVDADKAKGELSNLIARAAAGEEIVISEDGKPVAKLVSVAESPRKPREGGQWRGKIWIADDFDDPLPDELQRAFEEGPIFPEEDK